MLKREGLPDFEPESFALMPRKAGKMSKSFDIRLDSHKFKLRTEGYLIKNYWTREVKPGFQLSIQINY